mgnify:FL=1
MEDSPSTSVAELYDLTSPSYDALYREEQYSKYGFIEEKRLLGGFKRVLDAGCGTGLLYSYMVERGLDDFRIYVCLDASEGMVRIAASRSSDPRFIPVVAYIENTPALDKYFDVAYSVTVWDNLEDRSRALSELRRVAKVVVVTRHHKSRSEPPPALDGAFREIGFRVDYFYVASGDR